MTIFLKKKRNLKKIRGSIHRNRTFNCRRKFDVGFFRKNMVIHKMSYV